MSTSSYVTREPAGAASALVVHCTKVGDHEARVLQAELASAAAPGWRVVLDLSGVELLASAGLGVLVTLNQQCQKNGGKLAVHGINDEIMGVLKLTRLNKLISITSDRASAVKAVS